MSLTSQLFFSLGGLRGQFTIIRIRLSNLASMRGSMKKIVVIIAALALISNSEPQQNDPIDGAFGIHLRSNADGLGLMGFGLVSNEPGESILYQRNDPEGLLRFKTVRATPITRTITKITGSNFYNGSSLEACMRDRHLVVSAIKSRYPALKTVPNGTWSEDGFVHVEYASRLKQDGYLAGKARDSRSITVSCARQSVGGTGLIVSYDAGPDEIRASIKEDELDREQRTTERLRERGLNPDDL